MLNNEDFDEVKANDQTVKVNTYKIRPLISNFPPIILVVTPRFGQTRDLAKDKIIANQIKDFIKKEIDSINAVCLVA